MHAFRERASGSAGQPKLSSSPFVMTVSTLPSQRYQARLVAPGKPSHWRMSATRSSGGA
jgi:hypothetical protein